MKQAWISAVMAFVTTLATAVATEAAPLCGRIEKAMAATANNDATPTSIAATLSGFGPAPAACALSLDLSGARSANCNWAFPYRSNAAQTAFDDMLTALAARADPGVGIATDQPVNHPDFYDPRLLRIGNGEVGLSIKDKGGLDLTYVFLRLTP